MKKLLALLLCVGIITEAGILTVMLTEKYAYPYVIESATVEAEVEKQIGDQKYSSLNELQDQLDKIIIKGVNKMTASQVEQTSNVKVSLDLVDEFRIDKDSFVLESILVSN